MKALVMASGLLAALTAVRADVKLAPLFQDHAVLQRDATVPVWGRAEPGERVTVRFAGQTAGAVAAADGRWSLELAPLAADTTARELVVTGRNRIVVHDVLVGDVWLCAGQSNMQMAAASAANVAKEAAEAHYPHIRQFKAANQFSTVPRDTVGGDWKACSPSTFGAFTAAGIYFAERIWQETGVPVGLINCTYGNTPISSWRSEAAIAREPAVLDWWAAQTRLDPPPRPHRRPAACYNGMVCPLLPYALRGCLWYQGESDATEAETLAPAYAGQFQGLIREWRRAFRQDKLPFFWVQLAGYGQAGQRAWVEVREAQAAALVLPHTGQAVAVDAGDATTIHPPNKQAVGDRLARLALRRVYGRDIQDSGPVPARAIAAAGAVRVKFENAADGLSAHGDLARAFELAGADGRFITASSAVITGDSVIVRAAGVDAPVAVRFDWQALPPAFLRNQAGLPAAPFKLNLP